MMLLSILRALQKYQEEGIDMPQSTCYEFGGPIGSFCIIVFSHILIYYLWASLTFFQGSLFLPTHFSDLGFYLSHAAPTLFATEVFIGFVTIQLLLAYVLPGLKITGLPVPSQKNQQLTYLCNGIPCWYTTLLIAAILHFSGLFPLSLLADHMGNIMTVGVIVANTFALYLFALKRWTKTAESPSGNGLYDFFMGLTLNPRIGKLDIKLFSEIRIPWILLFFLTLSAAAKQYQLLGHITYPMMFMIIAHGLYVNACMKGEECIPTTWDIFHEKFGWMLIFWNYVGVPFVYCFQSFYILKNNLQLPLTYMLPLLLVLFFAYYVWDTANSQKNRFRMQQRGTFIKRKTFPQLPWGTLKDPKYLKTASGSTLLVDGWYRYARKIHYTADAMMAITWGLSCGFSSFLPYLYPIFFIGMISHRYTRDRDRCAKKYGADWERYCKRVRYKFIPFIY
ncbi:MAG: ERG4/ERG24 family protein [Gammaproteobacteria bacterium]|nr:ERG4/ERG24 family protein [Gammaproteobacteria bacterium]